MCCDSKCLFFIKIRTGSLIFGYITAFLTGFGVLGCTSGILYLLCTMLTYSYPNVESNLAVIRAIIATSFAVVGCLAGFVCTVLLLFGITENKPVLVKTHVIYGMINLVLLLAITIIIFCTALPVFGVLAFLGCGIYLLCIYMVYLTYKDMVKAGSNVFANENPLHQPML